MPRPPHRVRSVEDIPARVFASTGSDSDRGHRVVPLNVGDTWLPAIPGARMEDLRAADHPDLHLYADPRGVPDLIEALVEKLRRQNGITCEPDSVLVTAGATGALACALGVCAGADEEVLILAPFWPLIRGITQAFRARPVEVPFYDRVGSPEEAVAAVEARLTSRSVALYVSTPSNPTGRVIPEDWLSALAALARRENLWLLSDEVYEDYVYRGEHASLARLAPERTVSVFSFSKAYGMAGHRVGYLTGPVEVVSAAEKVGTHTFYAAPTAAQRVALRALDIGAGWVADARRVYRAAGDAAAAALGMPQPEGGTFLFLDLRGCLDERGAAGFLEDARNLGVALAPGSSCGRDYAEFARLCFTAAPPLEVAAAVERLAPLLEPGNTNRAAG